MGSFQSKPEFVTVLANKHVKLGETVTLRCEANTKYCIATWEKNGRRLYCVQDKHVITQTGKTCSLKIVNAQEADQGTYTLNLTNSAGSVTRSVEVLVELNAWTTVQWKEDPMINKLKTFKIGNADVRKLHFLLFGPTGGGKSSLINTIKSIFEGRQFINYLTAPVTSDIETLYFEKYSVEKDGLFPFAFSEIMAIQKSEGVLENDVISALKGHMKEGYMVSLKWFS
ncbi:hypothetical protein AOLI_G00081840 [Acnodon oligacanthus]